MSYITSVGTANPEVKVEQSRLADFMVRAMQLDSNDTRKLKTIFKASGIQHRHSVLEDYQRDDHFTFYPNTPDFEPFPSTEHRARVFKENAIKLSSLAAERALQRLQNFDRKKITHLIVVCCTGMYAPGLDIDLVKQLGLATSTQRTCINFMGCYAAFNAMKVADSFCKSDPNTKVLIVCTELCSIHFQKKATEDNMLANALFADGSAALVMEAQTEQPLRLVPTSFENDLTVEGEHDMAWTVGNLGFEMKLSSYVPAIIQKGIKELTQRLLARLPVDNKGISYYAIHPGGKKILEAIESELGITPEQNRFAYHVLSTYGNMSSPTVLFVLAEVFNQLKPADNGGHILSFAFGPGLTLESTLLTIDYQHA